MTDKPWWPIALQSILWILGMGLPEFARLLLAHAPPEAIEQNTLPKLKATASGKPPSIWV